ncbi:MAG: hypothetical protein ACE5GB_15445, partial [Acidimicrobiales bacterium]
ARVFVDELARDESTVLQELTPGEDLPSEMKVRTLVIPAGFTEKVLAGERMTLEIHQAGVARLSS